jgi:putative membrane protein
LRIGAWIRGPSVVCAWRLLTRPASGWIAHAVALWGWHAPPLFRMALENRVVHDLQHLSFIATALMFWTGLFLVRTAAQRGAAVFYLFTTTAHTGVLGAMITLADRPLYSPDFRDVSLPDALQDQQLGGLIMWVPGSMVYVAAGLVMFLQWVRASDAAAHFAPAKSPAGADHRPEQLS